jgi:transcriptional regulator with XRE-family HTH domain
MSPLRAREPETPSLGECLRLARRSRGLTLKQVSERTGLAISTLSKVENHQMTLTYDKLLQVSRGLEIDVGDLFNPLASLGTANGSNRRSVCRSHEGQMIVTHSYKYLYQHTDLLGKGMIPIMTELLARSLDEFGPMMKHDGEEYLLVIAGKVSVHTESYAPIELYAGDSIFIDSTMAHAYLNAGEGVARAICVCSASPAVLMDALRVADRSKVVGA